MTETHIVSPIFPTIVLLAAGVIGLIGARFARISPIIAFFILGALVGPQGLALIDNHAGALHFLAEIGVCFLLFDVGLHLSLTELRKSWRGFVYSGLAQSLIVTTVLAAAAHLFGLSWQSSIALGAIFSLSSTALVLKLLSDVHEENAPVGKRATEVLVFQDIVAIVLLVVFSGESSQSFSVATIAIPICKVLLAALFVIVIGKLALKPLFRLLIAVKNDEIFTASALLIVLLSSWATESLGLSLALGAFLGGLALSESSYAYLVRGEVAPFRSLLLSLFFLSVGLNLDVKSMWLNSWDLAAGLCVFVVLKIGANFVALRLAGIDKGIASLLAALLAQSSEFAFVLIAAAAATGFIDTTMAAYCAALAGLSLAVTPLVASVGCLVSRSICYVKPETDAHSDEPRELIIVRIDEFGRKLATLLDSESIPYRAHDYDHERLAYAESRGYKVFYSDLNRPRTLGRVSLGKALGVVCLI
jgi:Kef-type K+ transport system membrane component KefB